MTIPQDQPNGERNAPSHIRALSGVAIGGGLALLALIAVGEVRPEAELLNWYVVTVGIIWLALCALGWVRYIRETGKTRKLRADVIAARESANYWQEQYGRLLRDASASNMTNPPDPGR